MGGFLKLAAGVSLVALALSPLAAAPVSADTIEAALVRAYQSNPQLNAQRASV
ncbi:hypothetical protein BJ122_101337, partial [Rhodopseudomonas faecalis]